jgi:O-methyltransferase
VVWVADSFEGLPVPKDGDDGADLSEVDYLAVSVDQVKSNFARFGLLDDQVKFLKGWFSDTLPDAPIEKLAILRLDGDLYSSTMDAMTALYPKVSDGGYVIVDDYGSWPACKRAIDDYVQQHNVIADIKPIDFTGVYWQVRKS